MNTRTCTRLTSVILLALLAYVPATYAATATDNMVVRTHVVSNCMVTAPTLDFGQYDKAAGNKTDAIIKVNCTIGQNYSVGIGWGMHHPGGTIRQMASGTDMLAYELCKDAACGTVLDDSATGLVSLDTGNGGDQSHTVYGQILGNPSAVSGSYQDTVVVTVTYN